MKHEEVRGLLADRAAGDLSPWQEWRVGQHLRRCRACRDEWEKVAAIWAELRGGCLQTPPPVPIWPVVEEELTEARAEAFPQPDEPAPAPLLQEKPMRKQLILPTIAAAALAVAALLPATGWLVRQDAKVVFGGGMNAYIQGLPADNPQARRKEELALERAAAGHSDDFQVQLGYAFRKAAPPVPEEATQGTQEKVERAAERRQALLPLLERFPEEPALWAVYLQAFPLDSTAPLPAMPPSFLAGAVSAEKTDPENAYFTLIKGFASLSRGDRSAALRALSEAARKNRYNDYYFEQIQGHWALTRVLEGGESGALSRTNAWGQNLISNSYPALRALAKEAAAEAAARESAGKVAEGLDIRASLLYVGMQMQVESSSLVGNLVGSAVAAIATHRPGGVASPPVTDFEKPGVSRDEAVKQAQEARTHIFTEFVQRHGRGELAAMYLASATLRKQVQSVTVSETSPWASPALEQVLLWRGVSVLVLFSALWTIFFGGIAFALSRLQRDERGQGMSPAIGWGMGIGFLLPWGVIGFKLQVSPLPVIGGFVLLLLLALWHLAVSRDQGKPGKRYLVFFSTLLGMAVVLLVGAVLVMGPGEFRRAVHHSTGGTAENFGSLEALFTGLCSMGLPLLVLVGLALRSGWKKMPLSVGVLIGFRRLALPMASVLLLCYLAVAVMVARYDAEARKDLERLYSHETRYYAERAGKAWPPVPIWRPGKVE